MKKLTTSFAIILLTVMISCTSRMAVHKAPNSGQVTYVKKVMVADKHHGFRSVRVNYIVSAGDSSYYVNGRKMKLVAFDSTGRKNFKPTRTIN